MYDKRLERYTGAIMQSMFCGALSAAGIRFIKLRGHKMNIEDRQALLLKLTRKLVICTGVSLAIIVVFFFTYFLKQDTSRTFLTLIVFGTGLVGGFVSIQQRIHKVSSSELKHLSESWASVLLIPIYGGIFALVIHVIFLSEIITGQLFPSYTTPEFATPATLENFREFFSSTLPETGQDVAKMLFWAFCAGFSERLVPQIIQNTQSKLDGGGI